MAYPWEASYPDGVSWNIDLEIKPVDQLLQQGVDAFPENVCCEFMGREFRYRDIEGLVDRAAKGLQELGVGKGSHVGILLPNTPHYIVLFFAVLRCGATVVNYSPLYAEREIAQQIEDSGTEIMVSLDLALLYPKVAARLADTGLKKIIVCNMPEVLPFPKSLLFKLLRKKDVAQVPADESHIRFAELTANDGSYRPVEVDAHADTAVIAYTGGTTGRPKGAMLSHANLCSVVGLGEPWMMGSMIDGEERIFAVLPFFHIFGLTNIMISTVSAGSTMLVHPRFDADAVMKDFQTKRPTMFAGVPTMYTALVSHPAATATDFSSLKYCGSGGAPLPVEIMAKFEDLAGCPIIEGYGLTETAPTVSANPFRGTRKPGSVGLPLPQTVVEIVDLEDRDKVLGANERGEICVRGPQVMMGYWQRDDATAEAMAGDRFHTGDVGYLDDEGYLYLVDREKDMILSGGFNVYPRNIEEAIYEHPGVEEVTVIGIPDDYRGEAAKAFVKLKDPAGSLTLEELREFLTDKLGKHELPAELEIRAELPKTPVGKLSKKELVAEETAKRGEG